MSKLKGPDGRIPDRLPDGRPAVAWKEDGLKELSLYGLLLQQVELQLSSF